MPAPAPAAPALPPCSLTLAFVLLFLTSFFPFPPAPLPVWHFCPFLNKIPQRSHQLCCWAQLWPAVCPSWSWHGAVPVAPPLPTPCHLHPKHLVRTATRFGSWRWEKKKAFQNWEYFSAAGWDTGWRIERDVCPTDLPLSVFFNLQLQIFSCVFLFL